MGSILFDGPRVPRDAVFNMDKAGFVWSSRAQIGRSIVHVVGLDLMSHKRYNNIVTNLHARTHLQHVAYMRGVQVTHGNCNALLYYGASIQKCFRLTWMKRHYLPAMSPPKEPRIQIDPLDIENKSVEERVQLALAAIARNGFRPNGRPWLSLREAAKEYGITKGRLTNRFNGKQTKREAHQHEQVLDFAAKSVLVDWIKEMG